jgi:hypothetical protein
VETCADFIMVHLHCGFAMDSMYFDGISVHQSIEDRDASLFTHTEERNTRFMGGVRMRHYADINDPKDMIEYLIDCTLATVEDMTWLKSCPKKGEFERQCNIAQKGIDFLGRNYRFTCRANRFAKKETAFEYYSRIREERRNA